MVRRVPLRGSATQTREICFYGWFVPDDNALRQHGPDSRLA